MSMLVRISFLQLVEVQHKQASLKWGFIWRILEHSHVYLDSQCLELGLSAVKIPLSLFLLSPYLYLPLFSPREMSFLCATENIASGTLEAHPSFQSSWIKISWPLAFLRPILRKSSDWLTFYHVPIPEPITVARGLDTCLHYGHEQEVLGLTAPQNHKKRGLNCEKYFLKQSGAPIRLKMVTSTGS